MRAPPLITAWMPASTWPGIAVSRSTPNGLDVSSRTLAISSARPSPIVEAPSVPMPPASLTAATSWWYDTPPMPASMTGCSMSSSSVSRVRMPRTYRAGRGAPSIWALVHDHHRRSADAAPSRGAPSGGKSSGSRVGRRRLPGPAGAPLRTGRDIVSGRGIVPPAGDDPARQIGTGAAAPVRAIGADGRASRAISVSRAAYARRNVSTPAVTAAATSSSPISRVPSRVRSGISAAIRARNWRAASCGSGRRRWPALPSMARRPARASWIGSAARACTASNTAGSRVISAWIWRCTDSDARRALALDEGGGEPVERLAPPVAADVEGRDGGHRLAVDLGRRLGDRLAEQLLLGAEVAVDRRLRHARRGGDGVDAGPLVALRAEHLGGGVEDRPPLVDPPTRRCSRDHAVIVAATVQLT